MHPKHGGDPLPWPPIVLPQWSATIRYRMAAEYVKVLEGELAAGMDGDKPKWSGSQRQYLRTRREKWITRSMGKDPHYEKYGTFVKPWGTEQPTYMDIVVEETRRREKERGTFISNRAHKRKQILSRSAWIHAKCREWKKKSGAKNPEELKKEED